MNISGRIVDVHKKEIYDGFISIKNGKIEKIIRNDGPGKYFILPGLIDAHIHIESSMLTPGSFAAASVPHGTIGVVSDPHEIANVLGIRGVEYMIEDSERVALKFWFGAPSCVPATDFETSGGKIGVKEIEELLKRKEIRYLSEMMNYPGVLNDNTEIQEKIDSAKKLNKKIDGHAPGLGGEGLKKYISAGISTDHECSTLEEALEKISLGMKILIREGSAARNLDALKELIRTNPEDVMVCSDDLHPEMLKKGHINKLIAKLVKEGFGPFDTIRSATVNPVMHYGLEAGLLREGDSADFIVVDSLEEMNVIETWINGVKVFDSGKVMFEYSPGEIMNNFSCSNISAEDIRVKNRRGKMRIIRAFDGELFTGEEICDAPPGESVDAVPEDDILKIIVKDRYKDAPAAVGFIRGFNLKSGAFASSVAHDSHNIIGIGANDYDLVNAVNEVIALRGGMAVSAASVTESLKLEVAGIMSVRSCDEVASKYQLLSDKVKNMGCTMAAPFMTLSFMALLVIPQLKMSDRGLFDGRNFCHVPLFAD